MMKERVVILLATYNGEKFLSEQIKSILQQSFSNFQLIIRDDGSSDGTVNLIRHFSEQEPRIVYLNDKENYQDPGNVGIIESIRELLANVDADWYFLADQDDYWLPNKVGLSLRTAKATIGETNEPVLIHTDLMETDAYLNITNEHVWGTVHDDFRKILFTNSVQGCTIVINEALKKIALDGWNSKLLVMHDSWLALVATNFGKIGYIKTPTMLYRQHSNNVLGTGSGRLHRLKKVLKLQSLIERNFKTFGQLSYFYENYNGRANFVNYRVLMVYAKVLKSTSIFGLLRALISTPFSKPTMFGKMVTIFAMFKRVQNNRRLDR